MTWAHPHLLWLLAVPILLLIAHHLLSRRQYRRQASIGVGVAALTTDQRRHCQTWRLILQTLCVGLGIIALARPQGLPVATPIIQAGATVVVVIDCGPTAQEHDLTARGRAVIANLLNAAPEHRVALVPYAGMAVNLCPPSDDPAAVAFLLDDCRPELFTPPHDQRTVLGAALRNALEVFTADPHGPGDRVLVVISSGRIDDPHSVAKALAAIRAQGIHLLVLGDAPDIADIGGRQIDLRLSDVAQQRLLGALARLGDQQTSGYEERAADLDRWAVLAATLCLLLSLVLPQARRLIIMILLSWAVLSPTAAQEPSPQDLERLRQSLTEEPQAVQAALAEMLITHPDQNHLHLILGTVLLADDPLRAAAHLSRATALDDARLAAAAWHNLALAEHLLGRRSAAAQAAEQAAAVDHPQMSANAIALQAYAAAPHDEQPTGRLMIDSGPYQAHEQQSFALRLRASGDALRYRADHLPPGLQLDEDGLLHGQVAIGQAGRWTLPIEVIDSSDRRTPCPIQLIIHPVPAIITSDLPATVAGSHYRTTITSVGLPRPQWHVTGLPSGLRATPHGQTVVISGIPDDGPPTTIEIRADDVRAELTLPSSRVGFASADVVLPPATAGRPYRHHLRVRGPIADYRWQGSDEFLQCHEEGYLSGRWDQPGDYYLDTALIHPDGRRHHDRLQIRVKPPPTIATSRIDITAGRLVDMALAHAGGSPPLRWDVVEDLPQGLYLDEQGILGGVARQAGHHRLHVTLSDRWMASQSAVIDVIVHGDDAEQTPPDESDDDDEDDASEDSNDEPAAGQQDNDRDDEQDEQADDDQQDEQDEQSDDQQDDESDDEDPQQQPDPDQDDDAHDVFGDLEREALRHQLDSLPPERRGALLWTSPSTNPPPDPQSPWEAAP